MEEGEFQDWELLQNSDSDRVNSPHSDDYSRDFDEIENSSPEGMIRTDYFSLENRYTGVNNFGEGHVESADHPSWIDPVSETRFGRQNSPEYWSDSSSNRSTERLTEDDSDRSQNVKMVDNIGVMAESSVESVSAESYVNSLNVENDIDVAERVNTGLGLVMKVPDEKSVSDYCEEESISINSVGNQVIDSGKVEELDVRGEVKESMETTRAGEGNSSVALTPFGKSGGEGKKRSGVALWKVPFQLLKYCVLKVNPVWSFSMAAALMGFIILGRRLYKMKKKTKSLQLKVTMDDKKLSQSASRVARLNEAFSVIRRVPMVRPSLSAATINTWPVM